MGHLGLLSVLLSWAGLLFLIRTWKGNASMTFSQHAAQTKSAQLYYLLLWALCLPPFCWFLLSDIASYFSFGTWFKLYVIGATLGLAVAAAVPETNGLKVRVHRVAAFTMCYFMALITLYFALAQQVTPVANLVAWFMLCIMLFEIIFLNFKKRKHRFMLPLQALYIASFHVAVLFSWYAG